MNWEENGGFLTNKLSFGIHFLQNLKKYCLTEYFL